jgi:exosortase
LTGTPDPHTARGLQASAGRSFLAALVLLAALGGVLLWTYWTTLLELARRWASDPEYSHGYLVPAFLPALLWLRRGSLPRNAWRLNRLNLLGVPLLAAGLGLRLVGTYIYFDWLDAVSLLPCLAGLVLLACGGTVLRWALPAIAFLFFMVPLPFRAEVALAGPLQRFATQASTYALQTLGIPALSEGNVIVLNEIEMGIVDACSGLRMLMVFFALSTGVFLLVDRPLGQRIALLLSAVPIALIANVVRITATGVLHETAGSEIANAVFHDLAGWLMMPFALGLLWAELWLMSRLLLDPLPAAPMPLVFAVQPRPQPGSVGGRL